jgi:hypothetical protein
MQISLLLKIQFCAVCKYILHEIINFNKIHLYIGLYIKKKKETI